MALATTRRGALAAALLLSLAAAAAGQSIFQLVPLSYLFQQEQAPQCIRDTPSSRWARPARLDGGAPGRVARGAKSGGALLWLVVMSVVERPDCSRSRGGACWRRWQQPNRASSPLFPTALVHATSNTPTNPVQPHRWAIVSAKIDRSYPAVFCLNNRYTKCADGKCCAWYKNKSECEAVLPNARDNRVGSYTDQLACGKLLCDWAGKSGFGASVAALLRLVSVLGLL
jgi:hypothetical protein